MFEKRFRHGRSSLIGHRHCYHVPCEVINNNKNVFHPSCRLREVSTTDDVDVDHLEPNVDTQTGVNGAFRVGFGARYSKQFVQTAT